MAHYYHLLAPWLSLWYTTIFSWHTGPPYGTLTSYTGPLDLPWYSTIFHWPIGPPHGKLLSSFGQLAISMVQVHNYLLLAHWLSLWYTTIFYWPTRPYLYGTLTIFYWPTVNSLWYTTVFYVAHWPSLWYTTHLLLASLATSIWYSNHLRLGLLPAPNGTLLSSTGQLAISVVHWSIFYWPTGCLCGTLPPSTGPSGYILWYTHYLLLAHWLFSKVHFYYLLLAHWPSLWHTSTLLLVHWLSLWYTFH